jgi:hypothetical protein
MSRGQEEDVKSGGRAAGSRGAGIAFTVVALFFAAASLGGLFGFGLVIGWIDSDSGGIHRVHELAFGVLYGVITTTAFVAMAVRPAANLAAWYQVLAVALAGLVAGLIAADPGYLVLPGSLVVAAAILLALHPSRAVLLHPRPRPSVAMAVVAAAGAVPLVGFGLAMAALQRHGLQADPHVNMDHWVNMAAMAFGLVLVGLLAASGIRGWRVTAWCAGLGVAVYGLSSIVFHRYPGSDVPYPGSEGVAWGLAAMIGGAVFIAVAEWEARRATG